MRNDPFQEANASPIEQSQGPQLLTAAKLAGLLAISVRTLRRLQSSGQLPHPIRLGGSIRWRAARLREWCFGFSLPFGCSSAAAAALR